MTPPPAATAAGQRRSTRAGAGRAEAPARTPASRKPAAASRASAGSRAAATGGRAAGSAAAGSPAAGSRAAGGRAAGSRSGAVPRRVSGPVARPAQRAGVRSSASSRVAMPRAPRRVSGPIGGRVVAAAASAAATAVAALPQVAPRPQAPRRRPVSVPRPAPRRDLPAGARALRWLRALPDHRLLDRLIGGRVWIVLIGTLLAGIVTMQLTLLRLNAGIGHAIERSAALTQSNASLEAEISRESDPQRVIADATKLGYVFAPPASARYLTASPGDAVRALSVMRVPQAVAPDAAAVSLPSQAPAPAMSAAGGSPAGTGGPVAAPVAAGASPAGTGGPVAAPVAAGAATVPASPGQ